MSDDIEAAVQAAMAAVSEYRQAGTFRSQAPDNTPVEQAIRHVADVARRDALRTIRDELGASARMHSRGRIDDQ